MIALWAVEEVGFVVAPMMGADQGRFVEIRIRKELALRRCRDRRYIADRDAHAGVSEPQPSTPVV